MLQYCYLSFQFETSSVIRKCWTKSEYHTFKVQFYRLRRATTELDYIFSFSSSLTADLMLKGQDKGYKIWLLPSK